MAFVNTINKHDKLESRDSLDSIHQYIPGFRLPTAGLAEALLFLPRISTDLECGRLRERRPTAMTGAVMEHTQLHMEHRVKHRCILYTWSI